MCAKDWFHVGTLSHVTTGRHSCVQVWQGSSFVLNVQTFTVSQPLRWAFGYYVVCWLLLNHMKAYTVMRYRFSSICSFQPMTLKSQGTCIPEPHWLVTDRLLSRSPEGRSHPDKSMNCLCTAASFTVAVRSRGFVVLCQLTFSLRLIWYSCSSARRFASGFLRTQPRG